MNVEKGSSCSDVVDAWDKMEIRFIRLGDWSCRTRFKISCAMLQTEKMRQCTVSFRNEGEEYDEDEETCYYHV